LLKFRSAALSTAACKRPTRGASILDASAARNKAPTYSPLLIGGVLDRLTVSPPVRNCLACHASWPHEESNSPRSGPPAAQRCCCQSLYWRQRRVVAAHDTNHHSRGRSSSRASQQSRVRGRHGCDCPTLRQTQHCLHCALVVPYLPLRLTMQAGGDEQEEGRACSPAYPLRSTHHPIPPFLRA